MNLKKKLKRSFKAKDVDFLNRLSKQESWTFSIFLKSLSKLRRGFFKNTSKACFGVFFRNFLKGLNVKHFDLFKQFNKGHSKQVS